MNQQFDDVILALGGEMLSFTFPPNQPLAFGDDYTAFIAPIAEVDFAFDVRLDVEPLPDLGIPTFSNGDQWDIHHSKEQVAISRYHPDFGTYQRVVLDFERRQGVVHCVGRFWETGRDRVIFPYPMAELPFLVLLTHGKGVLLHACGCIDRKRGLLFAGVSGAGKSTLTRLWQRHTDATLLSDDRIIIRKREGRFWAYGTPWPGDARVVSPEAIPLERVFIIRHAAENVVTPLSPAAATTQLLVRSFPPIWDAEGMAFSVDLLAELSQAVPCYDLGFTPDERVLDLVRSL